jgi:elongation factor G
MHREQAGRFDYELRVELHSRQEYAKVTGHIQVSQQTFVFQNQVADPNVPTSFIFACEQGFREAIDSGILSGYTIQGVQVVLEKIEYHPAHSSDRAFRLAACQAFYQGMIGATPIILEPVMDVVVDIPTNLIETVQTDLISRRGTIFHQEHHRQRITTLWAQVPLAELVGYNDYLRSLTNREAHCYMVFSEYQPIPHQNQDCQVQSPTKV